MTVENDKDAGDLPENQASLNLIRGPFAQLQTLLGWIQIRARTIGELKSLSAILHKRHRNVVMACLNALCLIASCFIISFF